MNLSIKIVKRNDRKQKGKISDTKYWKSVRKKS